MKILFNKNQILYLQYGDIVYMLHYGVYRKLYYSGRTSDNNYLIFTNDTHIELISESDIFNERKWFVYEDGDDFDDFLDVLDGYVIEYHEKRIKQITFMLRNKD